MFEYRSSRRSVFHLLVWKNALVRSRHRAELLAEILYPVIFLLLTMSSTREFLDPTMNEFDSKSAQGVPNCRLESVCSSLLYFPPNDEYVQSVLNEFQSITNEKIEILGVDSIEKMVDRSTIYRTCGGVVFEKAESGYDIIIRTPSETINLIETFSTLTPDKEPKTFGDDDRSICLSHFLLVSKVIVDNRMSVTMKGGADISHLKDALLVRNAVDLGAMMGVGGGGGGGGDSLPKSSSKSGFGSFIRLAKHMLIVYSFAYTCYYATFHLVGEEFRNHRREMVNCVRAEYYWISLSIAHGIVVFLSSFFFVMTGKILGSLDSMSFLLYWFFVFVFGMSVSHLGMLLAFALKGLQSSSVLIPNIILLSLLLFFMVWHSIASFFASYFFLAPVAFIIRSIMMFVGPMGFAELIALADEWGSLESLSIFNLPFSMICFGVFGMIGSALPLSIVVLFDKHRLRGLLPLCMRNVASSSSTVLQFDCVSVVYPRAKSSVKGSTERRQQVGLRDALENLRSFAIPHFLDLVHQYLPEFARATNLPMSSSSATTTRTRRYRESDVVALNDVSLSCQAGSIVAIMGANGVGKSSLVSLCSGERSPTRGVACVASNVLSSDRSSSSVAFCPQDDALFPELTPEEHLIFFAYLRNEGLTSENDDLPWCVMWKDVCLLRSRPQWWRSAAAAASVSISQSQSILDSFSIRNFVGNPIRNLSGGGKRLVSVGMTLVGSNTPLILLDEPSAGVDPMNRKSLWKLIKNKRNSGSCVVLCSHFMEEVEILADEVCVLHSGRVLANDKVENFKKKFGVGSKISITLDPKFIDSDDNDTRRMLKSILMQDSEEDGGNLSISKTSENSFDIAFSRSSEWSLIKKCLTRIENMSEDEGGLRIESMKYSLETIQDSFANLFRIEQNKQ